MGAKSGRFYDRPDLTTMMDRLHYGRKLRTPYKGTDYMRKLFWRTPGRGKKTANETQNKFLVCFHAEFSCFSLFCFNGGKKRLDGDSRDPFLTQFLKSFDGLLLSELLMLIDRWITVRISSTSGFLVLSFAS